MKDDQRPATLCRREAPGLLAVTAGGGALMPASVFATDAGQLAGAALLIPEAGPCAVMPVVEEEPYYLDPALERRPLAGDPVAQDAGPLAQAAVRERRRL